MNLSGPELLRHAIDLHRPSHVFALFSGGHDSLCAMHRAMGTGLCNAVVHINTGVGLELTRRFVRDTCERFDWPLIEIRAKEDCGQDYEALVMQFGFPGPSQHGWMYRLLKERALEYLERKHRQHYKLGNRKRAYPIAFVSGVRTEESGIRMGYVQPINHERRRVWVAINHDWRDCDNARYIAEHGLPRNPVKETMCMSGECLCGAYAHKPELREWVFHHGDDPGIQKLLAIREKVLAKFPWDWDDEGPPKWWKNEQAGQVPMFDLTPVHEQYLCTRCNQRQDMAEQACDQPTAKAGGG